MCFLHICFTWAGCQGILTVAQVYLLPIPPFLMLIWVCVLGEEMPRLPFSQPPPPALLGKCQDISKNKLRDIISAAFSTLPVRHVQNTSLERAGCIRIRCLNHLNWLPSIWILLRVLLEWRALVIFLYSFFIRWRAQPLCSCFVFWDGA